MHTQSSTQDTSPYQKMIRLFVRCNGYHATIKLSLLTGCIFLTIFTLILEPYAIGKELTVGASLTKAHLTEQTFKDGSKIGRQIPKFTMKDGLSFLSPTFSKVSSDPVMVDIRLPKGYTTTDTLRFQATWRYTAEDGGISSFPKPFKDIGNAAGYALNNITTGSNGRRFQMGMPVSWFNKLKQNNINKPGEFKLKAILLRDKKEIFSTETYGWFKIDEHAISPVQTGSLQIYSPNKGAVFSEGQQLPIRVALPKDLLKNSELKITLWGQENGSSAAKVLWRKAFDYLILDAGSVFNTSVYLDTSRLRDGHSFQFDKYESGSYWVTAELISGSSKKVTSGKFSIVSQENSKKQSIVLAAPDVNRTYTDVVPVTILLPELPLKEDEYQNFQWSLELLWTIQVQQNPGFPMQGVTIPLAHQTFSYFTSDEWDGLDSVSLSRTWTRGTDYTSKLSFLIPVENILAKAGIPGGKVTLEARLLDKSLVLNSKKRSFQVAFSSEGGHLGDAWTGTEQKSATLVLDTPIILTPKENQAFLSPASVTVELLHAPDKKVITELQHAAFGKKKTDILLYTSLNPKGRSIQEERNKSILTYPLKDTGYYRIRAKHDVDNAKWSVWHQFTVDTIGQQINQAVGNNLRKDKAELLKMADRSAAPQLASPKMTGLSGKKPSQTLLITGLKHFYHAPATVTIRLKHANARTMDFELRHRAVNGHSFKQMDKVSSTVSTEKDELTLTLTLPDTGYYQIRFRPDQKTPWSTFQHFQITGNVSRQLKMSSTTAGKGVSFAKTSSHHGGIQNGSPFTASKQLGIQTKDHSMALQKQTIAANIVVPAKIIVPRNGQRFIMKGKSYHLQGEVQHDAGQKLVFDLRLHKNRKLIRLKPVIRQQRASKHTNIDVLLKEGGDYSLRVKYTNKNAKWSAWTKFTVSTVMKNAPKRPSNRFAPKKKPQQSLAPGMDFNTTPTGIR